MTDDRRPRGPREPSLSDVPTGQHRPPPRLAVEADGRTDKGRVRPGNEDAFSVEPAGSARARSQGTLLLVADGMGGHAAGEVASQLAIDTIPAAYYQAQGLPPAEAVRDAIVRANSTIFEDAERDPSRAGMGCTIVALVVQGGELTIGHVGDSRAYLIRDGQARQITRDHSWVAMQVAEGVLTPEQAEHHPNRNLIMRALGRHPSVEVELGRQQLQAGDVLIVCSDGLTGMVRDDEIAEYAGRYAPADLAEGLVRLANQRGAPDNVTVVAAAITAVAATGDDPAGLATTTTLPRADAPTPRLVEPPGDAATERLGEVPTFRDLHRSTAAAPPQQMKAPAGTPVVVSRSSAPAPGAGLGTIRSNRGRWLAGALAAFGLAAALILLTLLRSESMGRDDPPRVAEAPTSAAAPAARTVAAAPPVAATVAPIATAIAGVVVPPPLATGIPGLTVTGNGPAATATAPTAASASQPASAATPAGSVGSAIAGILATVTQVPALIASPPAIALPSVTPTTVQRSADESAAPADAGPADAPAAASDTASDPAAPDAAVLDAGSADTGAPDASSADAGAPFEPTAQEPTAQEPPPPPGATPGSGPRIGGPSGVSVSPIPPSFRPGPARKKDN